MVEEPAEAPSDTAPPPVAECSRCGWSGSRDDTGRGVCPVCRSFVRGGAVQLRHGARRLVAGRSPVDLARVAELRAAVESDLGGADQLSAAARALVADLAFAVVLRDLLAAHLAAVGPLTSRNQRRAALDGWDKASARVERLAARVGLGRRARQVDPHQLVREAVERAGRERGAAAGAAT